MREPFLFCDGKGYCSSKFIYAEDNSMFVQSVLKKAFISENFSFYVIIDITGRQIKASGTKFNHNHNKYILFETLQANCNSGVKRVEFAGAVAL